MIPEETASGRQPHNLKRELYRTNDFADNEVNMNLPFDKVYYDFMVASMIVFISHILFVQNLIVFIPCIFTLAYMFMHIASCSNFQNLYYQSFPLPSQNALTLSLPIVFLLNCPIFETA